MITIDENIFLWINGLAGNVAFFDWLLKGIANDYLVIVGSCLVLLVLWIWGIDTRQRDRNQKAVISASLSLGLSQGFVSTLNAFYFRPRPFTELPTNLLFYQPTDSSFPSNSVAIVFAITFAIFLANRRIGGFLFILAFLHAFSRVYVGVHYPFDVLAGAAGGILIAFIATKTINVLEKWLDLVMVLARKLYIA
ncbi:MAG: phosphatase PAP2 family protein [Dehalococcoidia bacterium]|nr:MAG: phosphatase PAP2 family protein [Dehalococcoidia bacterium]